VNAAIVIRKPSELLGAKSIDVEIDVGNSVWNVKLRGEGWGF
jgi:hypothetical protein